MPKFSLLVVDDNANDATKLVEILGEFDEIDDINVVKDGFEAARLIKKQNFDMVFLDIEMPGISGIELYSSLPLDKRPALVLVTAHEEFALQGFAIDAMDFLVKPVTYEAVARALIKVFSRLNFSITIKTSVERSYMFFLMQGGIYKQVIFKDVIYIASQGNYVDIIGRDFELTGRYTMKEMELEVPASYFLRVHQSFIVNMNFVDHLVGQHLFLTEGQIEKVPINRESRKKLIRRGKDRGED
ncbi:LytR/AlgR family response regulator transcription factor [Sphingobacterium pedocola]|uniref:DNA-binding response regulator n=1 Tax=Sphingobacterium pedocola TaxID=2082722 RepID=A0ABR9T3C1_9SPHI|nr:LytTR family DNA-binding domain-containing protein [Sphingobacterium pedocola]MBE8719785.1 hypothetical protein [Sphingobacterium pedocola]